MKMKIGFDNEKYLKMQSEHIRNRINQFDNKLYLEFGGKLFDDYHASRVLPGFAPDSKLRLLKELSSQAEIVIVISAKDIDKNKIRGDLGITYDTDVLRLIETYREQGLYVGSVVITQFSGQESALLFKHRLENLNIPVYLHYIIPGYPANIPLIISDEGYGKNDYIQTTRPLVIITAKRKDGNLPFPALSRAQERDPCRLCQVRDIPDLEPASQTSGQPGVRSRHCGPQ